MPGLLNFDERFVMVLFGELNCMGFLWFLIGMFPSVDMVILICILCWFCVWSAEFRWKARGLNENDEMQFLCTFMSLKGFKMCIFGYCSKKFCGAA